MYNKQETKDALVRLHREGRSIHVKDLDTRLYQIDTGMASFYGRVFEDIVGDVLTELGFEYSKETDTELRPDFIIDDHWVDAKLSQWTIYLPNCATIEKYEPPCSKLTIVFLRGDKTLDRKISKKTRIVNVTQLLKKLPKNRRLYFLEKVNEIEVRLNELYVEAYKYKNFPVEFYIRGVTEFKAELVRFTTPCTKTTYSQR